jgi:hypothetical protein
MCAMAMLVLRRDIPSQRDFIQSTTTNMAKKANMREKGTSKSVLLSELKMALDVKKATDSITNSDKGVPFSSLTNDFSWVISDKTSNISALVNYSTHQLLYPLTARAQGLI